MLLMRTPKKINIDITNRCNLRCRYCYHYESAGDAGSDLPASDWLRFFAELNRCAVMNVILAGGEPFIREDLKEIIGGIVSNRMRFGILSNGTLITDEMARYLASTRRCNYVQLSIDGSMPLTHDVMRGKGSFAKAVEGLMTLQRHGVRVGVRVTIHRKNVSDLEGVARLLLEELGLTSFGINSAGAMGLCRKNAEVVQLTTEDRMMAMETLLKLSKKYLGRIQAMAGPLAEARGWLEMEAARIEGRPPMPNRGSLTGCGCYREHLAVRADHAGSEENARYMSRFQETLNSIPLVKAFAAEEKAVGKIMAGLRQVFRLSAERSVVGSVTGLALSSTPSLVNFCVFAIGAYWVITGHWSLGSLFAFQAYLGRVFGPAQSLISTGLQMQNIRASLERITALLDVVPEENAGKGENVEALEGGIEFRNVSFAYDPKNPVLSEVSFRVIPSEHIAVVGPSGVGKTTLLSLLLRFYNPTGGEILYDGKPAADYDVRSLRQRIGYVSQSPILLSGTVLENLRYGNPDATKTEVMRAANVAGIHEFIVSLPGGYESEVGEKGVNLSEGQKQRLAIARALVKNPDILILDEPTAALDGLTEKSIFEALPRETRGKTFFVVAHRLSTVVDCDRILLLNENRLVAEGTHGELLRTNEYYRELVDCQLIPEGKSAKGKVIPYEGVRRHSRS